MLSEETRNELAEKIKALPEGTSVQEGFETLFPNHVSRRDFEDLWRALKDPAEHAEAEKAAAVVASRP